jgi:RNA polymerase sigma-70 factor (ECF subfamily)
MDRDLPKVLPELLPRLWTFALRISRDHYDAEELVQRACLRALELEHQLRPDTSPLSWMFSIVYSTWINELRSRNMKSRTSTAWNDSLLEMVADPATRSPECEAMSRRIIKAVEQLPDAQRAVVLLVDAEGRSYQEAAKVLDVPVGTVMSRLWRARRSVSAKFRACTG